MEKDLSDNVATVDGGSVVDWAKSTSPAQVMATSKEFNVLAVKLAGNLEVYREVKLLQFEFVVVS